MISNYFIILITLKACWAFQCTKDLYTPQPGKKTSAVESVLNQLNEKTKELQYYQAEVEYKFRQPLLESQSLRKGILYYAKPVLSAAEGFDKRSNLRVNFQTLKQDEEKERKYIEQFIFDGVWLTHIDYQIKTVKRYQMTEPNKPTDAFDLASKNLPIIGFTKIEDLQKQFEISLVEQEKDEPQDLIQLHLKVKPDSAYKDDYASIDFWIDRKLYLPAKVVSVTTEKDIYEIKFLKPVVNKKIEEGVFEYKIPDGFSVEIEPLKENKK